jgi:hypothetical protein
MAKKKKEPPSELANIETLELKAQLSRPSSSMNEETSFIEDIKTEWNLFWETLLGDEEDQAEAAAEAAAEKKASESRDPFENGKLEILSLDKVKAITKALSSDRKKLNQRLEALNKELDENAAKLETLKLVGGEAEETAMRIGQLSDLGQNISEQLNRINDRLKQARQREDAIKKSSRDLQ